MWKRGQSGNPNGRPKKPEIELFRKALLKVEKEAGVSLLEFAIRKAYKDTNVLVHVLKKIVPDLSEGYFEQDIKHEDQVVKVVEVINDITSRLERNQDKVAESDATRVN